MMAVLVEIVESTDAGSNAWDRLVRAGIIESLCKFVLKQCDDPAYPYSAGLESRGDLRASVRQLCTAHH